MHFLNLTSSFPAMPQEAQRDDASPSILSELMGNNDSKQQLIAWELASNSVGPGDDSFDAATQVVGSLESQ